MKISGAIKEIETSAPSAINVLAYLGIGILVVGVIGGLGNSVTVPSGVGTFLNTTLGTSGVTVATALITALTTIISLVIVAVLWNFFGLGKKGKKGSAM